MDNYYIPERQFNVLSGPILDKLAHAVRWYERNCPFRLEFSQSDTLVELNIIDSNDYTSSETNIYILVLPNRRKLERTAY